MIELNYKNKSIQWIECLTEHKGPCVLLNFM